MSDANSRRNQATASSNDTERGLSASPLSGDPMADLVDACRRGDRQGQRRLYEHCQRRIFALVVRMVGREEAEDVTQQVFLQAFRSIQQYCGRARFETWLYRLATNECLQFLRRARRTRFEPLDDEPVDKSPKPPRRVQDRELLERALDRLDPELRSIFLLREKEDMSYRELSEVLGISEGTVASRLSRARSQLKQFLVELGWSF